MGSYRAQGRHERAQVGAARVLDGKRVAAEWLEAIAADVAALHAVAIVAVHGERPPLHVVPSTSPVALNWCSTQHAGTGVGSGEGWDVGSPVGGKE